MKAVLADKIYLNTDAKLQDVIRRECTYKFINEFNKIQPVETERTYSKFKNDIFTIPIGRKDLIPRGYEIEKSELKKRLSFRLLRQLYGNLS